MGQPMRIVDLARDLIRLSSPSGGRDIGITYTGLRPGEKLEEALFGTDEEAVETDSPFLLIARPTDGASQAVDVARIEELAGRGDDAAVRGLLLAADAPARA
jgi:O-antigen biosynthesis protein WbqV